MGTWTLCLNTWVPVWDRQERQSQRGIYGNRGSECTIWFLSPTGYIGRQALSRGAWVLEKLMLLESKNKQEAPLLICNRAKPSVRLDVRSDGYVWMDRVDSVWDSLLITPPCYVNLRSSPVPLQPTLMKHHVYGHITLNTPDLILWSITVLQATQWPSPLGPVTF